MKKILCLALALVMAMSLATVAWGVPTAANCANGDTCTDHVAAVGADHYDNLQEAIKDAAPNGTVNILKDVTVGTWIMFAETLSISNGNIITLNINGLTINGNGHTLTVNSIESAGNGNLLFYDAANLNINNLIIAAPNGLSLQSGILSGVTFNIAGRGVEPRTGAVTIDNCTFNTGNTAIYSESAKDTLVVTNSTFNCADGTNVIVLYGAETFTGNTINTGRTVNVVSSTATVSGNTFNTRVKLYNEGQALSGNSFGTAAYIDVETGVNSVDVSGNYWGGGAPSATQIPTSIAANVTVDTYATTVTNDGTVGDLYYSSTNTPVNPPAPTPQPPVYYPPVVEDTTVTAPETFDAGIALQVGVSVMAAIGTVALSKKRED